MILLFDVFCADEINHSFAAAFPPNDAALLDIFTHISQHSDSSENAKCRIHIMFKLLFDLVYEELKSVKHAEDTDSFGSLASAWAAKLQESLGGSDTRMELYRNLKARFLRHLVSSLHALLSYEIY